MLRSIKDKLKFSKLLIADVTADVNSASFDVAEFGALSVVTSVGVFAFDGSNKVALKPEHSDDNSAWSACAQADIHETLESAGVLKLCDAGTDDDSSYVASYRGNKRYFRMALDVTGTVDVAMSVLAIGGDSKANPPS